MAVRVRGRSESSLVLPSCCLVADPSLVSSGRQCCVGCDTLRPQLPAVPPEQHGGELKRNLEPRSTHQRKWRSTPAHTALGLPLLLANWQRSTPSCAPCVCPDCRHEGTPGASLACVHCVAVNPPGTPDTNAQQPAANEGQRQPRRPPRPTPRPRVQVEAQSDGSHQPARCCHKEIREPSPMHARSRPRPRKTPVGSTRSAWESGQVNQKVGLLPCLAAQRELPSLVPGRVLTSIDRLNGHTTGTTGSNALGLYW